MSIGGMIAYLLSAIGSRDIETDNGLPSCGQCVCMVSFDNLTGNGFVPKLLDLLYKLVVKDIRQSLVENEGQDEIFELWGISSTTDYGPST